ncbi:hypothetical protein ACWGH3_13610 [Streptomyces sp. NPDC054884]|uniref:hypothetical protein n=1 Tax=Streptomyces sp. ME08-AFT2 TaxID=3028683 RepID=UPI0029A728EF|nr:hypothetical protein [Streptomyces sp. ME08-AFT2]MDX3313734.1 hypothetical protein [Streptomyces sp. ME08-AFT2]
MTSPVEASLVAVDLRRLGAARFDTGTAHGNIGPEQPALVDNALRAVLDLRADSGPTLPQDRAGPGHARVSLVSPA